jgi:GMP synthase (glutamine-hydrolysing)
MQIAVIHHLERPFLGHAAPALRAQGAALVETFRRDGDALPDLGSIDGIVTLGGEQSVTRIAADLVLAEEADWLRAALDRDVPVLGVCLGAQLLAHVSGAEVRRLPRRRLDWAPLRPTAAAREDTLFSSVPDSAHGVFWNEDGFDLPPGAVALAAPSGESCAAFRVGDTAWGVQFHPELDSSTLSDWYEHWGALVDEAGLTVADARRVDRRHLRGQTRLSAALFAGFARRVAARRPDTVPAPGRDPAEHGLEDPQR